ncbi:MAG: methyltransferase domain-containing protein [Bacteroidota bacterium]
MTKPLPAAKAVADFYDGLAPFYDDMTGGKDRFARTMETFRTIVKTYGLRTALDAGAGTGSLALILASLGLEVTAVDLSPQMIAALKNNAAALGLTLNASVLDIRILTGVATEGFDAVFCLGNTFAHLSLPTDHADAAKEFFRVLRPGGILILQTLNFDASRNSATLPHISNRSSDSLFDRRYARTPEGVRLTVSKENEGSGERQDFSLELRPIQSQEAVATLSSAGFAHVGLYGDLAQSVWNPLESKDLVIFAQKSNPID